jgi:DNA-binding CsgD family transcriptional regulator
VFVLADILLFFTTALVLSVTCLCVLLQVRARDSYTRKFLTVLIPLCLQMTLTLLLTYLSRIYPAGSSNAGEKTSLALSLLSIAATSTLLLTMCRYLIDLLPASERQKRLGNRIVNPIIGLFVALSLYLIILGSSGNWTVALDFTLRYHFFCGSMLMVVLGITAWAYHGKAVGWEQEQLLKGMAVTFLPLVATVPLDLLFFGNSTFKLAYLSFTIFVVYLYYFISRRYFLQYEIPFDHSPLNPDTMKRLGISERETQIVQLLIEGKTNGEIALALCISQNTVKSHVKNIYRKLEVSNRIQLYRLVGG